MDRYQGRKQGLTEVGIFHGSVQLTTDSPEFVRNRVNSTIITHSHLK